MIRRLGESILRLQEFCSDEKRQAEDAYNSTLKVLADLDQSLDTDLEVSSVSYDLIQEREEDSGQAGEGYA